MALELMKLGTEVVVGVADGLLDPPPTGGFGVAPLNLGGRNISYGAVLEAASVLVGGGMQMLMPFTLPDIADGLLDAGIPLLAARLAREFTGKAGGLSGGAGTAGVVAPMYPYSPAIQPAYASPQVAGWAGARASVGSTPGLTKMVLR